MGTSIHSGAADRGGRATRRRRRDRQLRRDSAAAASSHAGGPASVLERFDAQLTPEARSKLTLAALVPLPEHVSNQRFEPIFDRYRITGKTYTTASGTTVPNEIQYYNGEMVQVFGDCRNPDGARRPRRKRLPADDPEPPRRTADRNRPVLGAHPHRYLAPSVQRDVHRRGRGSGTTRRCLRLRSQLMTTEHRASCRCSTALNPPTAVYKNCARLFFIRLLDSTRVAIEVGRERMGTDKRPGTIDLTHNARIGISSQRRRGTQCRESHGGGRTIAGLS